MENVFDYEDIQLVPAKAIVDSRSECDTSIVFGGRRFKLPVVPANMQTIVDEKIAVFLAENDYFYIMHRFEPGKRIAFTKDMQQRGLYASISVGVKEDEYQFVQQLAAEGLTPEYITIDVAHGHSNAVINMIQHIKKIIPGSFVIAGNVGTPEAVRELENAGADATKVGIGPGKVCITKIKTGFGTGGWQLAAVRLCAKAASKPIIADGGIRTHGDIAKSVRFGASMVMIGSLFAGHEESPGQSIEKDGKHLKEHFPEVLMTAHFHDTRKMALANIVAALQAGVNRFDASAGGLGGCPFAPGATGNVATEDVVNMLHRMGISTGIDLELLCQAIQRIEPYVSKPIQTGMYSLYKNRA